MKTRRHHNNKGLRQVKRGKTRTQVARMARRLGVPLGLQRRPVPFEVWATLRRDVPATSGTHGVCLWGTQADATLGCEPDERVCLVRIEVLELLDE